MSDPETEEMRKDTFARFEEMGEEQVRLKLPTWDATGIMRSFAAEWLGQRNQSARLREEVSQTEMASAAARAADAADRAATAAESQAQSARKAYTMAIIANAIAILALIIGSIGLLHRS